MEFKDLTEDERRFGVRPDTWKNLQLIANARPTTDYARRQIEELIIRTERDIDNYEEPVRLGLQAELLAATLSYYHDKRIGPYAKANQRSDTATA